MPKKGEKMPIMIPRFKSILTGIFVFIGVILFFNFITVVPAGSVGVVVLFGNVRSHFLDSGIHIVNPFADVIKLDSRLQQYTMSIAPEEGVRPGDDAIDALTSEGLKVRLDLTAWFMIIASDAPRLYKEIGTDYEAKVIRPTLRTAIRDVVVKFTAEDIYSTKRDSVVNAITLRAQEMVKGKGIVLDRILLRNIILPPKIQEAIDAKLAADQDARRMEFVLQKESKEKERKIIEAEGIREANKIISQGLTPNYIQWYRIEVMKQLINSPNNTIIILPEDMKSSPVMMNMNK
jgi:regulator of protease activity HflC (stomatin/prohibitin superfamily)